MSVLAAFRNVQDPLHNLGLQVGTVLRSGDPIVDREERQLGWGGVVGYSLASRAIALQLALPKVAVQRLTEA